jgi:tetratricopeptide (TPR) repeat protein
MRIDDLEPLEQKWLEDSGEALRSLQEKGASCPPLRLIRALQTGAMPAELLTAVSSHVAACSLCRMLQADLASLPLPQDITPEDTKRLLARIHRRGLTGTTAGGALRRTVLWRWVSVAAGLVLCGALAVWQIRKPALPPYSSSSPVAAHEAPPAERVPEAIKLEKPPVKLTIALLTWRNSGHDRRELLAKIAPALDAYRADRFAEAAGQFEALSSKYPDSLEVLFYLGVCRLFLGQFPSSSEALEGAARLAEGSFASDVSWYLGLSYQRSGRIPEARIRFSLLCRGKSAYAQRACAALEALDHPSSQPSR